MDHCSLSYRRGAHILFFVELGVECYWLYLFQYVAEDIEASYVNNALSQSPSDETAPS